jgi:hypothetical protein
MTTFLQNKNVQPKTFIYICLAAVILLVLLHTFLLLIVFPHQAGFMNLHIPSRSGGYDLYVDTAKFIAINSVVLVVAVFVTAVVAGLTRLKKDGAATGVTFVLLVASIVYVALYVGSAFYILWGGLGATLGVIGTIAIGMALELPLLMWMNQNLKKQ